MAKKKKSPLVRQSLSNRIKHPIEVKKPPQMPPDALKRLFPSSENEYLEQMAEWMNYAFQKSAGEAVDKLNLLLREYGLSRLNPDCWQMLSLFLAMEYVPGFLPRIPSSGRPQKWNASTHATLYYAVEEIITKSTKGERKLNKHEACRSLSKKEPWKNFGTAKTLYNEYMRARDSRIVQGIRKIETTTGSNIDFQQLLSLPEEKVARK